MRLKLAKAGTGVGLGNFVFSFHEASSSMKLRDRIRKLFVGRNRNHAEVRISDGKRYQRRLRVEQLEFRRLLAGIEFDLSFLQGHLAGGQSQVAFFQGIDGMRNGEDPDGDQSGFSVSSAGDFNDDGFSDFIISAPSADGPTIGTESNSRVYAGEVYVVFGSVTLTGATPPLVHQLANVDASEPLRGFKVFGRSLGDQIGFSVSPAGDVNGDSIDDLIFGAMNYRNPGITTAEGAAYVLFGKKETPNFQFPSEIDLANPLPPGVSGFVVLGPAPEPNSRNFAFSVGHAGDLNNDGFDEVIIGAPQATHKPSNPQEQMLYGGEAYVIWGKTREPGLVEIDLSKPIPPNVQPEPISIIKGSSAIDQFGNVPGSAVKAVGLAGFSVRNNLSFNFNEDPNDNVVDPYDDVIVTAPGSGGRESVFVIYGGPNGLNPTTATIELEQIGLPLNTQGIRFSGVGIGGTARGAGDVNGDSIDDLIFSSPGINAPENDLPNGGGVLNEGEVYVVFGSATLPNSINVSEIGQPAVIGQPEVKGFTIYGEVANSAFGFDVSNAGDMNNDGFDDIVVGDPQVNNRGEVSVFFGNTPFPRRFGARELKDQTQSPTHPPIRGFRVVESSENGNLGSSVNFAGDVNNDGYDDVIVSDYDSLVGDPYGGERGQSFVIYGGAFGTVANRQLFYNRSTSTVFGDGSGNPVNSIDPSKSALLPGMTGSFANVSNYTKGLNGFVIDVWAVSYLTSNDFEFARWNGITSTGFVNETAIPTVSIIVGGGLNGTNRIKIEFADGAVTNTWLRVKMKPNANTGLSVADVFYFGSAVGEMNVGNLISGGLETFRTNASDTAAVRQNQSPNQDSVDITSIYDLNKDGRVNASDTAAVRQNQTPTGSIACFLAPPN